MTQFLTTDSLRLRALEPYDVDFLLRCENDSRVWEGTDTVAPYSRTLLEKYIESYDPDIFSAKVLLLIIENTVLGEPVGMVNLYDFDAVNRRVSIGYMVDEPCRNQRVATAALSLAVDYCRDCLGLHQMSAIVAFDNAASRRLLESAGFTVSGRLRSWFARGRSYADAFVYQRLF